MFKAFQVAKTNKKSAFFSQSLRPPTGAGGNSTGSLSGTGVATFSGIGSTVGACAG
jgi:hypothetical protein